MKNISTTIKIPSPILKETVSSVKKDKQKYSEELIDLLKQKGYNIERHTLRNMPVKKLRTLTSKVKKGFLDEGLFEADLIKLLNMFEIEQAELKNFTMKG